MSIRERLKKYKGIVSLVRKYRVFRSKTRGFNLFKTIVLNFGTQSFSDAIKFPILVFGKLKIYSLSGRLILDSPIKSGIVKIGVNSDMFSASKGCAMLNLKGTLIFKGRFSCSVDCTFDIAGVCQIGDSTFIGNSVKIRCWDNVVIGDSIRIGVESMIFDTNFHYVRNINTGEVHRNSSPVIIGSYSWIGNRTVVMKGTIVPEHTIVAGNSLLNKDYSKQEVLAPLLGGIPAKMISSGNVRIFSQEEEAKIDDYFKNNKSTDVYVSYTGLDEQ